ncbi:DNA mismatch repair protein MutS [Paenibacillus sp. J2TS4]|uniref:DNA mismatch repair protein MutS n=1 Tax=Paenibacillus sp. J2TS4 TaxID=2807194 RepID=UPI001B14F697|nr:DNA mismatch repair protein MutS [Paenibacillus sp. J2TS4]GIP32574.1 DNA mismatch repair protein MutS [Paenibacillus sp. J2TS4]
MTKYTPMMQQYLSIKAEAGDALLFFRLGDFYEMFFEDAIVASRELELTLTGRGGGPEERIPMCGVPYHSAESYIARLIDKGFKVAICEQVENPDEAKGIVRREIVKIVTPGTVMEGKRLQEGINNYIACLASSGEGFAFAACDLSTGELYVTATEASNLLVDELSVYSPSEVIGEEALLDEVKTALRGNAKNPLFTEWKEADPVSDAGSFFGEEDWSELGQAERRAVSILMAYLSQTQKRALAHITAIRRYETNQFMIMDPFTRRNLELVETVRERTKKGSLLWLLDQTVTSMGARMLRRWIEKPLIARGPIEERLEAVEELHNQVIVREDLRSALKEVYDLERLVGRICYGNANGRDLVALQHSLRQVPALREVCVHSGSATLNKLVGKMDDCQDIRQWIEEALVEEPPVSVRDGGLIRDGYHEYLDQLRSADRNGKQWIAELEQQERENTGIKSLKVGYNKVFGYYIEVTRSNLASIPEGRYERKQTLANAERFITPELKEKEALILEAQEKIVVIEYDLFQQLRERIAAQIERLQSLAEIVANVDVLQSLATVAAERRFCRPVLAEDGDMTIREGRHPVVEAVLEDHSFVANDTGMKMEEGRIMLITGPNMAGKSTYMRQVAIITIMAQIGSFIPAESATIPLIDRIFTRIGAADDLIGGQSTFMVEMMDIQVMTEKATERSLVIIDELGRGTSTGEGMAIAQAVIEYLHNETGCKTLVSTHFHELAHLDDSLPHLRNYCMAVKESGQQVTFLRKLIPGAASTSYGIYCAKIAGLPESIIERSYTLLSGFEARASVQQAEEEAAASAVQLSFFAAEASAAEPKTAAPQRASSRTNAAAKHDGDYSAGPPSSKAEQIAEQLKNADLINMTPLQAMNFLYELKQKC